jgi:Tfp pilus assembly protein PilF
MNLRVLGVILLAALCAGCQSSWGRQGGPSYQPGPNDPRRNTEAARKHQEEGMVLLGAGKLEEAEKEFKAAIEDDLFSGPAHNSLGTVYYRLHRFYEAAWEFQYAAKLMPQKAEPRNNLGLVFESAGKLDEAATWYEKALALEPDTMEPTANLARALVRANHKDERTRQLLGDVVMKDTRPEWVEWARQRLASMTKPETPETIAMPDKGKEARKPKAK